MPNDLKLLSQLLYSRGCSGEYLLKCLKLSERQTLESLERLLDANMIVRKNGVWRTQNLRKIYSIEKLISVEAKMCDMKKVLEQSLKNTWFASQSYILAGTNHPKEDTIFNIRKQGVGLYCKDEDFKKVVEAKKMSLPSSSGFGEKEAFRHYLHCLGVQCRESVRETYSETRDAHIMMLQTTEQLLNGLSEKGIKGQNRDFMEILDVNRAAIAAFDMSYQFPMTQEWSSI